MSKMRLRKGRVIDLFRAGHGYGDGYGFGSGDGSGDGSGGGSGIDYGYGYHNINATRHLIPSSNFELLN